MKVGDTLVEDDNDDKHEPEEHSVADEEDTNEYGFGGVVAADLPGAGRAPRSQPPLLYDPPPLPVLDA